MTNIEIQKHYENKSIYNGVYSRDSSSKSIKNSAYVMNFDEYARIGINWISLCTLSNNITYFASFGLEPIPKEIRCLIGNKNMQANMFRIQTNNLIMCVYFCIGFNDFMLASKSLIVLACFHLMIYLKTTITFWNILKMSEVSTTHLNLTGQTQYRLNKINTIKYYFSEKNHEREAKDKAK